MLHVSGPYLQQEFGWSVSLVGLCFGVCAITYAVASPLAGYAKVPMNSLSQNARGSALACRNAILNVYVQHFLSHPLCSHRRVVLVAKPDYTQRPAAKCAPMQARCH